MKNKIFVTKDALCRDYLPTYGNRYWRTSNIADLADKGTIFYRHYTGAPSTVMSNMCMFTGLYPYQSELSQYVHSGIHFKGDSLWTKAEKLGYECHIIWDEAWHSIFKMEERYYCYGENTQIHNLTNFRQGVGAHYLHEGGLRDDPQKTERTLEMVEKSVEDILAKSKKDVFLWLHVPHVINGRTGYGTDIDVFDSLIGMIRKYFDDDCIYISADHGNMNGVKGKIGYGHDVYEPSAIIPLITPRINGHKEYHGLTSNTDIATIIFDDQIIEKSMTYCDSTFYAQPNRKLAIITLNHKYIYNKANKKEELYDLRTDPYENCNLISDTIYDVDRHVETPLKELYFYPYWDEINDVRVKMRDEKNKIWRNGSFQQEVLPRIKLFVQTHGYFQVTRRIEKLRHGK